MSGILDKQKSDKQNQRSVENNYTLQSINQGTYAEATVVLMLNQGTVRQKGCNLLSGSFFGYFFGQAKK